MSGNWLAVVVMLLMIILDIYAHRSNIVRIIEDKENAADLQEALSKDLDRIKNKREKKLDKNAEEKTKIKEEFIDKDHKKSQKILTKTENPDTKEEETSKPTNE